MRDEGDDAKVSQIPLGAVEGKCRGCDARILWVFTPLGKRMPLDPRPVENGNVRIDELVYRAIVLGKAARERLNAAHAKNGQAPIDWYVSHFATCPERAKPKPPYGVLDRCLVTDQSPSAGAVKGYTGFRAEPCRRAPTTKLADGTPACDEHAEKAERQGDEEPGAIPDPSSFVDPGEL